MAGGMSTVKVAGTGIRQRRARETRRRMLNAAASLFAGRGYVPTTMADIADEAGVAVQTVHFTFHTKAELLRDLISVVSAGEEEPKPVMERPWVREALVSDDPQRTLALSVEHGTDIFRRMAPLRNTVETAASIDPEVAALWKSIAAARRAGIGKLLQAIAERGQLSARHTVRAAADIMCVIHSHDAFLSLVARCGWSVEEYKAWQYETLCEQLLDNHKRRVSRRLSATGLTYEDLVAPSGGQGGRRILKRAT